MQLNELRDTDGQETVIASQSIDGVSAGDLYYITTEINFPGHIGDCFFEIKADEEILLRRQLPFEQPASCGAFYASGLFASAAAEFSFAYSCYNDYMMEPLETWAAFDDIALFIYPASVTTETTSTTTTPTPTPPLFARQLLVNNDFPSGDFSPWEVLPESEDPGVTYSVVNGRATMKYTSSTRQAGLYQIFTPNVENGQSVRIQIDIYVDITSADTSCTTHVWSGEEFWALETVISDQYSIDVRRNLPLGANFIAVYTQCTGPATVAFDNAYLTVNPDLAAEPETTTTSSNSSSSTSPTPSVRATPSCPTSNTQTYTNDDGSQFMIVCGQD